LNHDGKKDCYAHKTTSLIPKMTEVKAETKPKPQISRNPLEKTVCNQSKDFMGDSCLAPGQFGTLNYKISI